MCVCEARFTKEFIAAHIATKPSFGNWTTLTLTRCLLPLPCESGTSSLLPRFLTRRLVRIYFSINQFLFLLSIPAFILPYMFVPSEEIYRNESSIQALPHIRTPLLIVNARDDPLFPETVFPPAEVFRANPHLIFACTRYGGHTAWAEGCTPWPNDHTYMDRVALDWINAHLRAPRHAPELLPV